MSREREAFYGKGSSVSKVSEGRDEKEQKDYLDVAGLTAAQDNFTLHGIWPSASGWTREPGEIVTMGDLPRFHDVLREMIAESEKRSAAT